MNPSLWPAKRHSMDRMKATMDNTIGKRTKNLDNMVTVDLANRGMHKKGVFGGRGKDYSPSI